MLEHAGYCFRTYRLWLLLASSLLVDVSSGCISRFAATRICVVDEETGEPVRGAIVGCSYDCINYAPWSGPKANAYCYRKTGDDNVLWILGHGSAPSVHGGIDTPPDNYYPGHGDQATFWKISYFLPLPIWLPPMRTLRVGVLKKLYPIPMYTGDIVSPSRFNYPDIKMKTGNYLVSIMGECTDDSAAIWACIWTTS